MDIHPCFECKLEDCDDKNPRCRLRRAMADFEYHRRHKQLVPARLRQQYNIARKELNPRPSRRKVG